MKVKASIAGNSSYLKISIIKPNPGFFFIRAIPEDGLGWESTPEAWRASIYRSFKFLKLGPGRKTKKGRPEKKIQTQTLRNNE